MQVRNLSPHPKSRAIVRLPYRCEAQTERRGGGSGMGGAAFPWVPAAGG